MRSASLKGYTHEQEASVEHKEQEWHECTRLESPRHNLAA